MGDEDKDQRTEEPTDKKRTDSFEKGRTAKSKEVSSTIVLLATVGMLYVSGGYMRENILKIFKFGFTSFSNIELSTSNITPMAIYYMKLAGLALAPMMLAATFAGILVNVAQNGGFILTADPMMPKFNKINPLKGVTRLFSKQSVMELFKSLVKIAIVTSVVWTVLEGEWANLPKIADWEVQQVILYMASIALKLMIYVLLVSILLGIIDFAFQKYTFEEGLKMTKQEVKDERKGMEGDPQVKARIRSTQMAMAKRRMMTEVPKAEVVITNPTHLAIAIAYDRSSMGAPIIVAKGAGLIAARIREIAKENEIPLVEDKPLARLLFKTIPIGGSIPEELYRTIAEILAYVYKLKGNMLQNN